MYPSSSSFSSSRAAASAAADVTASEETFANVTEISEEETVADRMTTTASGGQATTTTTPSSAGPSSSSSSSSSPISSLQAASASATVTAAGAGCRPTSLFSHRPAGVLQLVEQRLRSSWGRPAQSELLPLLSPTLVGGEPSHMHQLIAKIGCGANAGRIIVVLPTSPPASSPPASTTFTATPTTGTTVENQQLQEHTESSSSLLHFSEEWYAVEERCKSHAHEATHLDRRGRTCLHAACAKKAPVSTIKAILNAMTNGTGNSNNDSNSDAPLSVSASAVGSILLQRDKHGRTPLLIAIASHANLQVITMLLQKSPQAAAVSDHLGNLPLMLACEIATSNYTPDDQIQLVRLLLLGYPQAAQRESFNGRMALHAAIECNAPTAVVALLVQVYPQAVICDGCGLNSLFLAIRYNVSIETIQVLVAACPEATLTRDRGRGMPFRRAIENQSPLTVQACLCTCPLVVMDADIHVHNTVLHTVLECGGSGGSTVAATTLKLATVELMLRMAPQLAMTKSKSGQTPLTLACQQWQRFRDALHRQQLQYQQQQLLLLSATTTAAGGANATLATIHTLESHCQHMWLIIITLMKAAFYGVIDDPIVVNSPTLTTTTVSTDINGQDDALTLQSSLHQQPLHVLHAAVSLQQLPLDVVIHALELYVQDASTRNDPSGRYPLQLCILTSQPLQQQPSSSSQVQEASQQQQHPAMAAAAAIQRYNQEKNLFLLKEQVIMKTLQVFPQATQLPDVTGRLALSLAAQQATSISTSVLQELWSHYPAALVTLDPVWRLYPFQIAAVQKEPSQQQGGTTATAKMTTTTTTTTTSATSQGAGGTAAGDWKEMQDLLQLSAIFLLLKQRPDLIHLHLCKS